MDTSTIAPLPPGFVLDKPSVPALPPGFVLDSSPHVPLQNVTAPRATLFDTRTQPRPAGYEPTPEPSFVDKAAGAVQDPLGFVTDAPGTRFFPVVTPGLELLKRSLPEGVVKQGVKGLQEGTSDVAEAVTSPSSLALIASGGGAEMVAPALTKLGFSGWMGYETAKGGQQTYEALKRGDVEGATRAGVGTAASAAGTILPLKGIVETEAVPRPIGPKGEEVTKQVRQPGTLGEGMKKAVERNKEKGAIKNPLTDFFTKEKDETPKVIYKDPYVNQQIDKVTVALSDPEIKAAYERYQARTDKEAAQPKTEFSSSGLAAATTRSARELEFILRSKGHDLTSGNISAVVKKEGRFENPEIQVGEVAPKGGGESTLSEADRTKSRENNSKEAFLKANKGKLPTSESGMVTIPPAIHDIVEGAVDKLKATTKQIGDHFKRGNLREVLSYTRDATDVQPKLYARQAKNHVLNKLENVTAKENLPLARKALTFVVEAKDQIKSLDDMRKTIVNSEKSSANKKEALQVIDYARQQWNPLQQVAKTYKGFTDQQIQNEQGEGFEVPVRQGYVHHAQDIDMEQGFFSSGEGEGTSFKKQRDYATYAESIAAGVKAKTIDSIDLLEHRLSVGQKMVAMKQWVDSFRTVTDPATKDPLIARTKIVERPDGTQYVDVPKGYSKEWMGGQVVAVHKGWEGLFSALTDPSWWSKSGTREAFQKLNATAKSTRLLFDTFHLGRIAIWNGFIRAMDLEKPNPFSYRKGKTLLDYDEPTIQDMAKKGQIPKEWVKDLGEKKRVQDLLVSKGLNVGRILDSLHQDWVQKIPGVIGGMNKWLFDSFQRGVMQEIASMEFDRVKKGSPNLSEDEVARRVVKDVNTRFGSLGRQGLLKSKTAQDHARLLALAPQWNESLIRSELGALRQTGEFVYNKLAGEKIASGLLMRSVGGLLVAQFMANQLINYYTRGYPTWDNKEEGIGAKLSAFIPDKIGSSSGFFLHPAGLAAETAHLLTTKWEKSGSLRTAIQDYVKGKVSSLDQLVEALWTGDTKDVVPFPIATGAVTSLVNKTIKGGPIKEEYPGQVERQLLSSSGVRTDQVPSPHQRIARLAREFNEKQGIVHKQEPPSDYQGLNEALRTGDMKEAQKQLDELKKTKPLATLIRYYAQEYPKELFTGKKKRERAFEQSLSQDDKELYQQVLEERKAIARKGLNLVRGPSRFSAFEEDEQPQPTTITPPAGFILDK